MSKVQELADDIVNRRRQEFSRELTKYPRKNLILSDIQDCDRANVYGVLNWKERKGFDVDVIPKLQEGRFKEKKVVQELLEMGYEIRLQQEVVEIKGKGGIMLARGRIDFKMYFERTIIPAEVKSLSYYVFNSIHCIDDLRFKSWTRKYLRQLLLYMFGNNVEEGLFILEHRNQWKLLPVYLDLGECEMLLQKLERAYAHIESKTYPERIVYDMSICGKCDFAHVCLPDILNSPAELIDNEEYETMIDEHEKLKPIAGQYKKMHDKLKATMENIEKVIVGGRWLVQNVPSKRTVYDYPEEVKKEYSRIKDCNRLVINKLGEK